MRSFPLRQDIIDLTLTGSDCGEPGSSRVEPARLRPWRAGDVESLVAAWSDPEIARWNAVPSRRDAATAAKWISGVPERLEQRLSMDWVIEIDGIESRPGFARSTGPVVGEVGLSGFSDHHHGALIGYWLLPSARGRGIASIAVAAVIGYAHRILGVDPVVARCDPANLASGAVARRSGCRRERVDSTGHELWVSRGDRLAT